jgi:hypothetical protein
MSSGLSGHAWRARWIPRAGYLAAVLLASACGGSTAAPSPAALHAEIGDPAGDALPDPSDRISPDLVHGTIDVSNGMFTIAVKFAPGAFDPATSRLTVQLDTDQNASTGIRAGNLGVDYIIDMFASTGQAAVLKAVPTGACTATDPCYVQAGTAPLSVAADGMTATLPLSIVGSSDGHLMFRVLSYLSMPGLSPAIDDAMPDMALAPAHVP